MKSFHFLYNPRSISALLHDICALVVAWYAAYQLRFNLEIPVSFTTSMWLNLSWVLPLQLIYFFLCGLYEGVWRFASTPDLERILKAVGFGALSVTAIYLMAKPFGVIPRSVMIFFPVLLLLIMGGSRFAYRGWKEHRLYGMLRRQGKPVLVLGAGDLAIALVKDLSRSEDWQVVGLLDNDKTIAGRQLMGVKVLGAVKDLPRLAKQYKVDHVIIAMPAQAHQMRRQAVEIASKIDLKVLTAPAFDDLISGKVSISKIRKVEVEDLLGRDPVNLDITGLQHLIEQRVVMVTGAGGSIGAELCRQIVKYQPGLLICVDISEYSLYQIEQNFTRLQLNQPNNAIYLTADVKNAERMQAILKKYQPSLVFHAAAYKHVPMMENHNVAEALANNVLGTFTVASACKQAGVSKFVLISTDKAINPTNVMGASKRLAEMVCQGLQEQNGTQFVIVRFGNVLGSSGSVIPKFREQIASGGPVTITHPDITRYFMSIPEAAQLVMQAAVMGTTADIFVLDMGEPVKITHLAQDMIRLSGLPENEIKIVFTGLRAGEKLYEELLADDEKTLPTPHLKIRIAIARKVDISWVSKLLDWIITMQNANETQIKKELKTWVEEYKMDTNPIKTHSLTPQTTTIH